jgi:hypothetical protein
MSELPCSPEMLAAPNVIPSVPLTGGEPNLNVAGAVPLTESISSRLPGFAAANNTGVAGASVRDRGVNVWVYNDYS